MPKHIRLRAWIAFWGVQAIHLAAVMPSLGMEPAMLLTLFQTGLSGAALTAMLGEKRR